MSPTELNKEFLILLYVIYNSLNMILIEKKMYNKEICNKILTDEYLFNKKSFFYCTKQSILYSSIISSSKSQQLIGNLMTNCFFLTGIYSIANLVFAILGFYLYRVLNIYSTLSIYIDSDIILDCYLYEQK